jgi:hypothetical protein
MMNQTDAITANIINDLLLHTVGRFEFEIYAGPASPRPQRAGRRESLSAEWNVQIDPVTLRRCDEALATKLPRVRTAGSITRLTSPTERVLRIPDDDGMSGA